MPVIPPEYLDSIVVLLAGDPGEEVPMGTAFVMSVRDGEPITDRFFLVTCEHNRMPSSIARFNTGHTLPVYWTDWTVSPDGADVVAFEITGWMGAEALKIGAINEGRIVKDHTPNFGVGVELVMLGLLTNEGDRGTNVPVARFGALAARAHPNLPLKQGNDAILPTHLADMRSRAGFSGSPVFGYWEFVTFADVKAEFGLLGVHSAQYWDEIPLQIGLSPHMSKMPSSMTKIVPAWYLKPLLKAARRPR